jgi:hypothetical protein
LERLEERARSRAASRREPSRAEKPVKLSPEEQKQRDRRTLKIFKIMVEHGLLEMPPENCPRNGPGEPLCSGCRRFDERFEWRNVKSPLLASDDEVCGLWRVIAASLPMVEDDVVPEYRYRDDE